MRSRCPAFHRLLVLALALPGCGAAASAGDDFTEEDLAASAAGIVRSPELAVARVAASGDDGNVATNVVDGDLATRWSAKGDPWLQLDLAKAATVNAVRIAFHRGDIRKARFDVQVSEDGASWKTTRTAAQSSGKTLALEDFTFAPRRARFVRIVGHGNVDNEWTSLTEVRVFGEGDAAPPPPAPPSTGGATPPPPPPPPPATPGTAAAPSDLLDLRAWKITLPLKATSGSGPREVLDLKGFTASPYFELNAAKDAVQFRAHAGGATTSGSSYPRSELREMTTSGALAAWSTSSGKHTMTVREAITALPTVKPHVVAGQIHDAEDDVVMVRLEGKRLFLEANGQSVGDLDPAYVLGTVFTVTLAAQGGRITATYNGVPKVDYARAATGCYFKAGVYTQSNVARGEAATAYGEVLIHELRVTHE